MEFTNRRSFWVLLIDTIVAIAGIVGAVALKGQPEMQAVIGAVWAAAQPLVYYIVKALTVDDTAEAVTRKLASRGLTIDVSQNMTVTPPPEFTKVRVIGETDGKSWPGVG